MMVRRGRLAWATGLALAVVAVAAAATATPTEGLVGATMTDGGRGGVRDNDIGGIQVAAKTHDDGLGAPAGAAGGGVEPAGNGADGGAGEGGAAGDADGTAGGDATTVDDAGGLIVLDGEVPGDGSGGSVGGPVTAEGDVAGDEEGGLIVLDGELPEDGAGGDEEATGDDAGGLIPLDGEVPDDGTGGDDAVFGDDAGGLIELDGEVPDDSSADNSGAPEAVNGGASNSGADGEGPVDGGSVDGHDDSSHGGGDADEGHSDSDHSGDSHGGGGAHDGHSAPAARLSTCVLPGAPGGPRNYSRCMALPGQVPMSLYWDVDQTAGILTAAFVAQSIGWAAFGWNGAEEADQMLSGDAANPNLAIVGMTTAANETSVGVYALRAQRSAGVQPVAAGVYTNLSASRTENGALVVGFTRPLGASRGAPAVLLDGTPVNGIWSAGGPPPSETALAKHIVHGLGAIDFTRSDTDADPADGDDDESACFPSSATVVSPTRGAVRMDALRVGDVIAAGVGRGVVSEVYLFTHADGAARSRFVVLATGDGRPPLVASPGHYVHLADGRTVAAWTVAVGDALVLAASGAAAPVTAVSSVVAAGLYNPQTLRGDIVVDGYAVSTYTTAVAPAVAVAALAPMRAVYAAGGGWLWGGVGGGVRSGWPRLAALLPSGRDSL